MLVLLIISAKLVMMSLNRKVWLALERKFVNLLRTVLVLEVKPKFRHRFTGLTFRVKCFTMNKGNFTHCL